MLAAFETEKKSNGRGKSFAGVLKYLLHDKKDENAAEFPVTSERARVLEIGNIGRLADQAPSSELAKAAYHDMRALCDEREARRQAGEFSGPAIERPVFHYFFSFHSNEQPEEKGFKEALHKSLTALGLEQNQYIAIIHDDGGAPHCHVVANVIDPDTMRANALRDSKIILKNFGIKWDVERGLPYSDELIQELAPAHGLSQEKFVELSLQSDFAAMKNAKFAHRKRMREEARRLKEQFDKAAQPDVEQQPKKLRRDRTRAEHLAIRDAAPSNAAAVASAAQQAAPKSAQAGELTPERIREESKERAEDVAAMCKAEHLAERAEKSQMWADYQQRKKDINAHFAPDLEAIAKHRRDRNALPITREGVRDWAETAEWKALSQQQYRDRVKYKKNERTAKGRRDTAWSLAFANKGMTKVQKIALYVHLLENKEAREAHFKRQQDGAKKALGDLQWSRRMSRMQPLYEERKAMLDAAYKVYVKEKTAMIDRHKRADQARKAAWATVKEQRTASWGALKAQTERKNREAVLQRHGKAPYQHSRKNGMSYFVELSTGKTYWGADLARAVVEAGAQPGDRIEVERDGQGKTAYYKNATNPTTGQVQQFKTTATRTKWTVTVLERHAEQAINLNAPEITPSPAQAQEPVRSAARQAFDAAMVEGREKRAARLAEEAKQNARTTRSAADSAIHAKTNFDEDFSKVASGNKDKQDTGQDGQRGATGKGGGRKVAPAQPRRDPAPREQDYYTEEMDPDTAADMEFLRRSEEAHRAALNEGAEAERRASEYDQQLLESMKREAQEQDSPEEESAHETLEELAARVEAAEKARRAERLSGTEPEKDRFGRSRGERTGRARRNRDDGGRDRGDEYKPKK